MRRIVSSPDETPRRELKIWRAAEYFDELRGVSFVDDDSVEYLILLHYPNKTILEGKIKDAIISSFSSDFQTLILYFLYELLMSWESILSNCWRSPIPTFQSPNFRGRERLLQGLRWNLELTFTPKEQTMTTGKYILKLLTWSFLLLTTLWSAEFYSVQGLGREWVFLLTLLMTTLFLLNLWKLSALVQLCQNFYQFWR